MFWLLALISAFGYGLQSTLMAKYARSLDALTSATYRSLCLMISMTPLLLLVDQSSWSNLGQYWLQIIIGGLLGGAGVVFLFQGLKSIPVGIANAISTSFRVFLLSTLGFLMLGQKITLLELVLMLIILIGVLILSTKNYSMDHLKQDSLKGVMAILLFGTLSGLWNFTVADLALEFDPYLAGYFLEAIIGIWLFVLLAGRSLIQKKPLPKISFNQFRGIFLASAPTLLGTGAMAVAATLGNLAIISVVGSAGILFSTILAIYLYDEKLELKSYLAIALIILGVTSLKVFEQFYS